MALTNTGRNFIAKSIINDSPTFFNEENAHIGVGDSTSSFSPDQEDLQGSSKTRKLVDEAPSRATNEIQFKSIFNTGEANHEWKEWGVFNSSTGGEMLNRKVENLGTKSGGVWVLTVTLSVNIGQINKDKQKGGDVPCLMVLDLIT